MACPICKNATVAEWRPFCSRRCADLDLGRWLTGSYAISGDETDAAQSAPDPRMPPSQKTS